MPLERPKHLPERMGNAWQLFFDLAEADKAGYAGLKKYYLENMPKNRSPELYRLEEQINLNFLGIDKRMDELAESFSAIAKKNLEKIGGTVLTGKKLEEWRARQKQKAKEKMKKRLKNAWKFFYSKGANPLFWAHLIAYAPLYALLGIPALIAGRGRKRRFSQRIKRIPQTMEMGIGELGAAVETQKGLIEGYIKTFDEWKAMQQIREKAV